MSALSATPASQAHHHCRSELITRQNLFIEIEAHPHSLSRIANVMAKLDILPNRFDTTLDPQTGLLEVRIETGTDPEPCERLHHRLLSMVAVKRIQRVTVPAQVAILRPV